MKMVVEPLTCRVLLSWLSDLPFVSASSSGKQGQQPPPTGAVGGVKVTHASTRASQGIWLVPFHGPPPNGLGFGHMQAPCSEPSPVTALGTKACPPQPGSLHPSVSPPGLRLRILS